MSDNIEDFKPEAWVANATLSTTISLVDTFEGKLASFKPSFTYPIFGETEQVFGYKDLEIILAFDSKNFTPFLNVKFSEKLDDELLLEKAKMDANIDYDDEEEDEYEGEDYHRGGFGNNGPRRNRHNSEGFGSVVNNLLEENEQEIEMLKNAMEQGATKLGHFFSDLLS